MNGVWIRGIHIEHVRHLRNVDIPLETSDGHRGHLIITGENGSGKTALLDSIAGYLDAVCGGGCPSELGRAPNTSRSQLSSLQQDPVGNRDSINTCIGAIDRYESVLEDAWHGIGLDFNVPDTDIQRLWQEGECVLAHFGAYRRFEAIMPMHIEKVSFADRYAIEEAPRDLFVKYLLDLKMTQALAMAGGRDERAAEIGLWFDRVRDILREVYEDLTLELVFDEETFRFSVCRQGHEPHGLDEASDGLSAVLDIIVGLMLRMVRKNGRATEFDLPGIALIDEIEAHLHLSLQRRVLPILATLFPGVQFVVTTHSPFVLSSLGDATVFDLETKALVRDGLAHSTYESIVEGYFNVDTLSKDLRKRYDRYRELSATDELTDDEFLEARELELALDEVPDFLALGIAAEYQRAKLELYRKVVA